MTKPLEEKQQKREEKRKILKQRRKRALRWFGYICLGYFGLIVIFAVTGFDPQKNKLSDKDCNKSLNCVTEKAGTLALVKCQRLVENQARFDYEWTNSMTVGPRFELNKWKDKKNLIITYAGDNIKFQNGFGAWSNMKYICDYDVDAQKAIQATAIPGRW